MRMKITVIGAGNVGATTALRLAERNYADLVLVDVVDGMPQGKALDLAEAGPVVGFDSTLTGITVNEDSGWEPTADSDIIVITSGMARKPGMSRDDLVQTNAKIVASVARNAAKHSPKSIFVVVSNPLDAMAHVAMAASGFPRERVIGMAGILDTARFRTFIADELNVSRSDIQAYVIGGHGDTMIPLTRLTTVGGVCVEELIDKDRLASLVQRTRDGGAEIVGLLKSGSAYYAPSAAVTQMVDAIVFDSHAVLPVSMYLEGEYGVNGVFTGIPCQLSAQGIERVFPIELNADETAALHRSAEAVRDLLKVVDQNGRELGLRELTPAALLA